MANPRYIQAQSFQLGSGGASAGATSITIQSFLLIDGVTPITTAMLGDQCYATLEPNNGTQEESMQFTGVTQNANGTATLTGVSSVGFVYPYTVTSGLALSHAGGVTFVLSNDAGLYGNIISYINGIAISGSPTASDTVFGITKLNNNLSSNPRAMSTLISQQGSPNMTLLVNSFSYQNFGTAITFTGKTLDYINGVSSSTFVAPVSNPRYDLIVYRPSLTDCTSITGTENASPQLPTPMLGDLVLASIYHRVGETSIKETSDGTNGYVYSWYQPSIYNPSSMITSDNVTNGGVDQSQAVSNGIQAVGKSNVTGQPSIIAEKFVPTVPSMSGVSLLKLADTGTFSGTVKIALQADTGGSPSGTDLASYTISNAAWLELNSATLTLGASVISANLVTLASTIGLYTGQPVTLTAVTGITGLSTNTLYYLYVASATTIGFSTTLANAIAGTLITISGTPNTDFINTFPLFSVNFGTEYESMVDSGSYWIVITPSTSDSSNHPNLGLNTAGGYASGVLKYNNSADGWVSVATSILYFQTLQGIVSKVVETGANGLIPTSLSRSAIIASGAPDSSVTSTTSATTLFSQQIPGGYFNANDGFEVKINAGFIGRTSNGDSLTLKILYNGSTLFTSGNLSFGSGASTAPTGQLIIEGVVQNNGSTSSQLCNFTAWQIGTSGAATTLNLNTMNVISTVTAIDLSQPGLLQFTFTVSNSSDTGILNSYLIKKLA